MIARVIAVVFPEKLHQPINLVRVNKRIVGAYAYHPIGTVLCRRAYESSEHIRFVTAKHQCAELAGKRSQGVVTRIRRCRKHYRIDFAGLRDSP
jgi:hypothetical protein